MTTPEYYIRNERHDLWEVNRLKLSNSFFCLVEDKLGYWSWKPYFSIGSRYFSIDWGKWCFAFSTIMQGHRK